jgi:NAD(P)-dependent dehydrogenase (short-subunit alcohol dehydrogenase family)
MLHWTAADIPDLSGRTIVVTGANAGLGLEITKGLAGHGATVVMACRNTAKAQAAAASIRQVLPSADLSVEPLDLADLASVERFADGVLSGRSRLDALVNNAGLMAVDPARTVDGFEMQLGVNHLGHFALTARLLPLLLATPGSRVASMSSMGHRAGRLVADDLMFDRRGYQRWNAYFQSKLANLLFTAELHRLLTESGAGTIAVAAHPGASRTDLGTEGAGVSNRAMRTVVPRLTQPADTGALAMLRAVSAPDVRGGQFYGPRYLVVGHPVVEVPSKRARNAQDARRLWELSADLVGLHPRVPSAR